MHIVIMGQAGSGKTTLAEALSEQLDLPFISAGGIARALAENDPATRLALQQGARAPEEAMREAIRTEIEAADVVNGGWILEGFPRDLTQLICLMQWSTALPCFFLLECTDWTAIERLTTRGRADDNPDAISRRIRSFNVNTMEAVTALEESGMLSVLGQETSLELRVARVKGVLA